MQFKRHGSVADWRRRLAAVTYSAGICKEFCRFSLVVCRDLRRTMMVCFATVLFASFQGVRPGKDCVSAFKNGNLKGMAGIMSRNSPLCAVVGDVNRVGRSCLVASWVFHGSSTGLADLRTCGMQPLAL